MAPNPRQHERQNIRHDVWGLWIMKPRLGSAGLRLGPAHNGAEKDVKSNENDCSRTGGTIILNKIEKARKSNSKTFQLCISQNYIFEQLMQMLPPQ